jgi:hypothetical protein
MSKSPSHRTQIVARPHLRAGGEAPSAATGKPAPRDEGPGQIIRQFWGGWDRFWFKPADPTTLGFIRILCGLVILYVHLDYSFGLLSYVGPDAWMDLDVANYVRHENKSYMPSDGWGGPTVLVEGNPIWSVFYHVSDPRWIWAIHVAILVAMALFTVGFCTPITSVLAWAGALCYVQRAPMTLFGQDTMMVILLTYLMIGPSGAALSVDRWLERRRANRRGEPDSGQAPAMSANFIIRLMQIHLCIIYLAAGTSKLLGSTWWAGIALWRTYANYAFAPFDVAFYRDFLVFLCKHRLLWELVMSGGVVLTLFVELGFPFLVWIKRLRWTMVAGAVLLHTGIGLVMGLVTFSLFMMILLYSFVPPEATRQLVAALGAQARWLFAPRPERAPERAVAAGRA